MPSGLDALVFIYYTIKSLIKTSFDIAIIILMFLF